MNYEIVEKQSTLNHS